MKPLYFISFLFTLFGFYGAIGQNATIVGQDDYFGIDQEHKIIVWNPSHLDSVTRANGAFETLQLNGKLFASEANISLKPANLPQQLNYGKDTFKLYVTDLPIIKLNLKDSIVNEPKRVGSFSYIDATMAFKSAIGIELRGNSALRYPKKSYDMELRKHPDSTKSIDASFSGMREDDDWLFNSLYNEPLKLRSYFANKLWLDINSLWYAEEEEKAKSGIDVAFAEVFLNDSYHGIYILNEQVDRKLLKLEKFENNSVSGELLKATSYQDNTSFKAAPAFRNIFPHWGGFEVKYPYENYEAHWEDLHAFVKFVATAEDSDFSEEITQRINLENAIDYFLFTNLLRATDNLGKNYFLAKYKKDSPYIFVPWDLDGILGIIQDGKRIPTTNDILSNHLFDRLKANNAADYNTKLKARWKELRMTAFSNEALFKRINTTYHAFTENGLYERDATIWSRTLPQEDDYEYLSQWLSKRLLYLDSYFD